MSETPDTQDKQPTIQKKPGLFSKLFQKLDDSMKEKADEKSKEGGCCGSDGKGGKCC